MIRMLPAAEKLSFLARGVVINVPGTNAVLGSTVSVNVTPVASSPVAPMTTLYFNVSPGSALPSISTSVNNESTFVAVTVGAKTGASGANERFALDTFAGEVDVFATSGALGWTVLGCDFHNHPGLLDSTEMEKATAAVMAIPAMISGATRSFSFYRFSLFVKTKSELE